MAEFSKGKKQKFNPQSANDDSKLIEDELKLEMIKYDEIPALEQNKNPIQWWGLYKEQLPNMAHLAKKYLSAPLSSVESERVFSIGGNLYSLKRNRITAETGKMLMFLHYNFLVKGFNYN